jgi:hypothetical protein
MLFNAILAEKIKFHFFYACQSVFWIHDILVWIQIGIRRSMPLADPDSDPNPLIYVIDLQDATNNT